MDFLPLHSHLELARFYWKMVLQPGDWAIDATCGNGKDTLQLGKLSLGGIIGLDKQQIAIENTSTLLKNHLQEEQYRKIHLFCASHIHFPDLAHKHPIRLIIYNLGYLPGSNKKITTITEDTLKSLKIALELIIPGGLITFLCYPGHAEGAKEQIFLVQKAQELSSAQYVICHHTWPNKHASASLLLIQKKNSY
ncbi:MAG TPA: class I SAM-dependent methyltransferase [Candidatus Rhabdochlamydia sp.]|jgi:Putative rRNA methylase|nr:class I SAM-dependent methyltransferase [Candidatus Rhabdochlamydia sp.]